MPTTSHQDIVAYLYGLLLAFVTPGKLGKPSFAGIRVRLWPGKFREPDIVFMLAQHLARVGEQFWKGADLVMVVSVVIGSLIMRKSEPNMPRPASLSIGSSILEKR